MPAPQTKSNPPNGTAKGKAAKAPGTSIATPAPKANVEEDAAAATAAAAGSGRPDKADYDAEQERLKSEIDALQVKVSAVREKLSLASKSGGANDRRNQLRAEMDSIRGQQNGIKTSRTKLLDQVKSLQEGISKKTKDLQAAKNKIPFKTVADVDAHIKNLEKQVESGSMKLAEEKRALLEISQTKKMIRSVQSFQAEQDSIEADRKTADELRKQLDDPASKAISDRYEEIRAELEQLKKESDEAYAGRSKLIEERDAIQNQVNTLFNQKRESTQRYRDANDRYWAKVNEDRARRAERARTQRAAEEAQKKLEIAERLREEAALPAFQAQIEDCQTLIDYLSGKSTGNIVLSTSQPAKTDLVGVPKLELRKVEAAPDDNPILRKKKGEEDEAYFVGKSKSKGKKGSAKANGSSPVNGTAAALNSKGPLNMPLPTLTALLSLSIPAPSSAVDISRVVEDLKTKKAWFEANQARVTSENVAKAEAEIKRLTQGSANAGTTKGGKRGADATPEEEITPPNGGAERPAEPAPTPASTDLPETAVPSEEVAEKLVDVQEEEEANGDAHVDAVVDADADGEAIADADAEAEAEE